jgi:hypothetical protein
MIVTVPESGFVDIKLFQKILDISKIVYYTLKHRDGCLVLKFYDKNKRLIKPFPEKKSKKQ